MKVGRSSTSERFGIGGTKITSDNAVDAPRHRSRNCAGSGQARLEACPYRCKGSLRFQRASVVRTRKAVVRDRASRRGTRASQHLPSFPCGDRPALEPFRSTHRCGARCHTRSACRHHGLHDLALYDFMQRVEVRSTGKASPRGSQALLSARVIAAPHRRDAAGQGFLSPGTCIYHFPGFSKNTRHTCSPPRSRPRQLSKGPDSPGELR